MNTRSFSCSASFLVTGEELDPDRITAVLGLQPTESRRRGRTAEVVGDHMKIRTRTGVWVYSLTSGEVGIEELLNALVVKLARVHGGVRGLPGVEYACFDVFYSGTSDSENYCNFSLSLDVVAMFARVGVPVHFTIGCTEEVRA